MNYLQLAKDALAKNDYRTVYDCLGAYRAKTLDGSVAVTQDISLSMAIHRALVASRCQHGSPHLEHYKLEIESFIEEEMGK